MPNQNQVENCMCEGLHLLYVLQENNKKNLSLIEMKGRFLLKHLKLQKYVVTFARRQEKGHSLSNGQMVYSALANNSARDFSTATAKASSANKAV